MAVLSQTTINVSIIILNYKTDALTMDLIKNLGMNNHTEIILVDNNPSDSLRMKVPKDIRYIYPGENLGFARGNNLAIRKARGKWILLLNSDTVTNAPEIEKFIKIVENHKYLAGAPKLVNIEGKVQNSVGYFDGALQNVVNFMLARPRFINCSTITENIRVDLGVAAALLLHRSVFKHIGAFDEHNFHMYFEDIDFCYRLHKNKIPILYSPDIKITHLEGSSSNQNLKQKNANYKNGLRNYLKKHRGTLVAILNEYIQLFK